MNRDACIHAVAAFVMTLQEAGATSDDIVGALEAGARCEQKLRAALMIEQITPDNVHPAIDDGGPVGNEFPNRR